VYVEFLGGDHPLVDPWYTSTDILSPDNPPLETDGPLGSIIRSDVSRQCRAEFVRPPGTVVIEVARVDDARGVAQQLAKRLAPRFPVGVTRM